MTDPEEVGILSRFYLDKLIQIADKNEFDRERFVKGCVMALHFTVDRINFKTYETGKESE